LALNIAIPSFKKSCCKPFICKLRSKPRPEKK
jgi:hypothetical protein